MIDASFVETIAKIALATAPRSLAAPAEPPHVYYVVDGAGNPKKVTATPPPAEATAGSVADLVAWVVNFPPFDEATVKEIYYSRTGVVGGIFPTNPQNGRIRYELEPSPQLATLENWAQQKDGQGLTQAAFIRILSTTFADALPDFVIRIRQCNFQRVKDTQSAIEKGRVSVSKKDLAELSGGNDLPTELTFRVPVFSSAKADVTADVRVYLELDLVGEKFLLFVLPGQIEAAYSEGEDWLQRALADALDDAKIPLYLGSP
jgi:hypothetical protein